MELPTALLRSATTRLSAAFGKHLELGCDASVPQAQPFDYRE